MNTDDGWNPITIGKKYEFQIDGILIREVTGTVDEYRLNQNSDFVCIQINGRWYPWHRVISFKESA